VLSESTGKNNRSCFYLYCRQHGLWPKEVAGHDPDGYEWPRQFADTLQPPPSAALHWRHTHQFGYAGGPTRALATLAAAALRHVLGRYPDAADAATTK